VQGDQLRAGDPEAQPGGDVAVRGGVRVTMSQSMRSAGWNQIGAPVASRSAGAAVMWSLCPWVSTIAVTVRSPIASMIGAASCGASMTRTSSSSPTSQTLFSTSKS
jgi:hypothetical protein